MPKQKRDLKELVNDEAVSLATVLRQVKILAYALDQDILKRWIDAELKGYSGSMELPDYRVLRTGSFGTFRGSFHQINNQPLPLSLLPEKMRSALEEVRMGNAIREIEALAERASSSEELRSTWPAEAVMLAREHLRMDGDAVLVDAWQPLPIGGLQGILDAVRNQLLDFLLELEALDPAILESEEAASQASVERVTQIIHTTISGDHNIVAAGKDFSQQVSTTVAPGDFESLSARLFQLGVEAQDVAELKEALAEDSKAGRAEPESGQFGARVSSWLGRMTSKAATGAWNMSVATAPQLLALAIAQFLGLG